MDLKFIEVTERMLATKKPICRKIVYSQLWLESWLKTTKYRIFMEGVVKGLSNTNIEIY